MSHPYVPAAVPTLHFIGVTTGQSAIRTIFPRWAERLGLGPCALHGMDFPLHASPAAYRAGVRFIREDPLSYGALVTSHKIDVLHHCRDLFDTLVSPADILGEVGCLSKRDGRLVGHAMDAVSGALALEALVPGGHWETTRAAACIIGAGGACLALSTLLLDPERGGNIPARVIVSDCHPDRLAVARSVHARLPLRHPIRYVHTPRAEDNDRLVAALPPGSLVVNATGLGKDAPGSPVT